MLRRPFAGVAMWTACSALVVVANAWQLLVPAAMIPAIFCGVTYLRDGPKRAVPVGLAVVATSVLCWPPLWALLRDHALSATTVAGGVHVTLPRVVLICCCLASAALAALSRDARVVGTAALLMAPAAIALYLVLAGAEIDDYYPTKLLWHSTVLGLAALGVVLTHLYRRFLASDLAEGGPRRVFSSFPAAILLIFLGLAVVAPWRAFDGLWSTVNGDLVLDAVTTDRASEADVVWLGDTPTNDSVARILLTFYRVGGTWKWGVQSRWDREGECRVLRSGPASSVLTTERSDLVGLRYSCVPRVDVIPVRR